MNALRPQSDTIKYEMSRIDDNDDNEHCFCSIPIFINAIVVYMPIPMCKINTCLPFLITICEEKNVYLGHQIFCS